LTNLPSQININNPRLTATISEKLMRIALVMLDLGAGDSDVFTLFEFAVTGT
jgi:hypothetical protein